MSSSKAAAEEDSLRNRQESVFPGLESAGSDSALDGVPPHLHLAVDSVHKGFTDMLVGWGVGTRDVCYAQLHDDWSGGRQELLECLDELCVTQAEKYSLQKSLAQTELPRILKGTFNLFLEGLRDPAERAFKDLLAIGSSHSTELSAGPVEWAQECVSSMIRGRRDAAQEWIREACGAWAEWACWHAPRLLAMAYGATSYDGARLWEPLDPNSSWALVQRFADNYVNRLLKVIEQAAREAHIERALTTQSLVALEALESDGSAQTPRNSMLTTDASPQPKEAKRRARKPTKPSPRAAKHRATIRHLSDLGFDGREYCVQADKDLQFSLRRRHSRELGAPTTYTQAFDHPDKKWRQAVWEEKYRVTKRLKQ